MAYESVGRARIIRGLGGKSRGGYNIGACRTHSGPGKQQDEYNCTHRISPQ